MTLNELKRKAKVRDMKKLIFRALFIQAHVIASGQTQSAGWNAYKSSHLQTLLKRIHKKEVESDDI